MKDVSPARAAHMRNADPFVHINEQLELALDLLKVVYLGMNSPDRDQVFKGNPLRDVVLIAIDKANNALDISNDKMSVIWEEAEKL